MRSKREICDGVALERPDIQSNEDQSPTGGVYGQVQR